ncbi:MAG: SPOR domain-containing protein [Desulfobacterales bacterium]|nr:SPOR domain-containing protein [Desulfobacterales bacterium]
MNYEFSFTNKKFILLLSLCIAFVVFIFISGLFTGISLNFSEIDKYITITERQKEQIQSQDSTIYALKDQILSKDKIINSKNTEIISKEKEIELVKEENTKLIVEIDLNKKASFSAPGNNRVGDFEFELGGKKINVYEYPYSLRLAAYRTEETADRGIIYYEKLQLSPYALTVDLGEKRGIWRYIYTGHYKSKKDALGAKESLNVSFAIVQRIDGFLMAINNDN